MVIYVWNAWNSFSNDLKPSCIQIQENVIKKIKIVSFLLESKWKRNIMSNKSLFWALFKAETLDITVNSDHCIEKGKVGPSRVSDGFSDQRGKCVPCIYL